MQSCHYPVVHKNLYVFSGYKVKVVVFVVDDVVQPYYAFYLFVEVVNVPRRCQEVVITEVQDCWGCDLREIV